MKPRIRWMIRRDMPEVLAIENHSFSFPWTEDDYIKCLRQRNCIGMVAEHDDEIVGCMIYELLESKLHLLNFAVHQSHRNKGVGRAMIRKLVGKLTHDRRTSVVTEVRETNDAAVLFFARMGFRAIELLRDHYEEINEDAYLFRMTYAESQVESVRDYLGLQITSHLTEG